VDELEGHGIEAEMRLSRSDESPLEELGIVTERTGQKKNRIYSYQAYVDLLSG